MRLSFSFFVFVLLVLVLPNANAQCGKVDIKQRAIKKVESSTYAAMSSDPKISALSFKKAKDAQTEHRETLRKTGKDFTVYNSEIKCSKIEELNGGTQYSWSSNGFVSDLLCRNDTVYQLTRPAFKVNADAAGKESSYLFTAAIVWPTTLSVGDVLPEFRNFTFTTPSGLSGDLKIANVVGLLKTNAADVYGNAVFTAIKNTYADKKLKFNSNGATETIGKNRKVISEEEFKVNGKKYKAYKIESEIWTRIDIDLTTEDFSIALENRPLKKADKKVQEKTNTNDYGYNVSKQVHVFVPELMSFVEYEVYNIYGLLTSKQVVTGFE